MAFQKNVTTTTRAALQTRLAANAADINTIYRITDAVGSTKVIDVIASTVSALYGNAENLTDSTFGVYDISANTFVVSGDGTFVKKSGDNMTGALLLAQSTSIASAGTVNLATATGNIVPITGSTGPITSLGTVVSGEFTLIFASTPTLTHNATSLILPTGANIVVQAGDVAQFVSLGSGNWKCTSYQRANGSSLVGAPSSLAATLAVGNTTGGTDVVVSDGDKIVLESSGQPDVELNNGGGLLNIAGGFASFIDDGDSNGSTIAGPKYFTATVNTTTPSPHIEAFEVGQTDGSSGFKIRTEDGTNVQQIILKPDGFTTPLNYQSGQTFTNPYEIVNKEYVDGRPIPAYTAISLGDWTTLVGASGLIAGTFYRVTSAYTFDFYGAKDVIVLADSANTVQSTGWVVFADYFVPYQVDASLSNPGIFFDCVQAMALDPDAAYDYINGAPNWRFNQALLIFLTGTDTYIYQAQVQGDDPAQILFKNTKAVSGPNLGLLGTFTPQTAPAAADDFFTPSPYSVQIRLELDAATIDAGVAVDIPNTTAPSGYFADATDVRIQNIYGSAPYTNEVFVQTATSTDPQWGSGTVLLATSNQFKGMIDLRSDPAARIVYVDQRQLQVVFSGTGGGFGDGTAVLFITVQFIKITA